MRVLFIRTISCRPGNTLAVEPAFTFTAQPEAPAAAARKADVCGWEVID
jgi:hypothetical protein